MLLTEMQSLTAVAPTVSPHCIFDLKCNETSGAYAMDSSGRGNDASPLNALPWKAGQPIIGPGRVRVPTIPNGKVYEVTAVSGTATTGANEPNWPGTAGQTVPDNVAGSTITWTCRAVPDFWTAKPGWLTITGNSYASQLFFKGRPYPREYCLPYAVGAPYTGVAGHVSFLTSDNSINTTDNDFPVLVAGDFAYVSGDGVNPDNNVVFQVGSRAANKIIAATGFGFTTAATPAGVVTLQKVLPPPFLLFSFWINSSMTAGAMNLLFGQDMLSPTGPGFSITFRASPSKNYRVLMTTPAGLTSTTVDLSSTSGSVDTHFAIFVDRATLTARIFKNAVNVATPVLDKRALNSMLSTTTPQLNEMRLFNPQTPNGVTSFKNVQLYVGYNPPYDLRFNNGPDLLLKLYNGLSLSASDWS